MRATRRHFLGLVAASSVAGIARPPAQSFAESVSQSKPFHAYVASDLSHSPGIHVFDVDRGRWRATQFIPAASPSALALSPDQKTLFVANRVRTFQNLPSGSVESYRVNDDSGHLTLISRRQLALSATEPGHLAVSPDGKRLAVAVTGGGAYNVLPITDDGALEPVRLLRKELGAGPVLTVQSSASPRHVLFDPSSRLIGADLGSDRVSVFQEEEAPALHAIHRTQLSPGSGPHILSFDSSGSLLFVGHGLQGSLSAYQYNASQGTIGDRQAHIELATGRNARCTAIACMPNSNVLLASWGNGNGGAVGTWRIDSDRSTLSFHAQIATPAPLTRLVPTGANPDAFVALESTSGRILSIRCNASTGHLVSGRCLATVPEATALVLRG